MYLLLIFVLNVYTKNPMDVNIVSKKYSLKFDLYNCCYKYLSMVCDKQNTTAINKIKLLLSLGLRMFIFDIQIPIMT